jgi:hypothetical protein
MCMKEQVNIHDTGLLAITLLHSSSSSSITTYFPGQTQDLIDGSRELRNLQRRRALERFCACLESYGHKNQHYSLPHINKKK